MRGFRRELSKLRYEIYWWILESSELMVHKMVVMPWSHASGISNSLEPSFIYFKLFPLHTIFLQALWRGHRSRRLNDDPKVLKLRHRLRKVSAEVREEDKLCNKTSSALDYLLRYKHFSYILEALKNLGKALPILVIHPYELPATLFSLWTSWSSWPLTCTHHHPAFCNRVEQDKCQMWEKVPLLLLFWLCVVIAKCLSCVVQIRQFITYKGAYCVPPKSEVCNVKSKLLFMWAWSRVFSASRCPEH